MIGKRLSQRYGHGPSLAGDQAVAVLTERLGPDAAALVQVRAQGPHMVACLVVRADADAVRVCRELGLDMRASGSAVFGLQGSDAARLLPRLSAPRRAWLATPCEERETKVLLMAGGIALLAIETRGGEVVMSTAP
jgi:hypothetical protein